MVTTTTLTKNILRTPPFRVSFPEVFQKRQFDDTQKPRYSVVGLFQPFEVADGKTTMRPKDWNDADRAKWLAILQACNKVSLETFKKPMKELDRSAFRLPFHKGEEKTYAGYGLGIIFFTMASTMRKPGIVDVNGNTLTADGEDEFYAGCWARASVNPYAFNNKGKGIAIGLGNLQKLKNGDRLDAFSTAEDDFGSDPVEFGDDVGDDTGGAEDDFGTE